MTEELVDGFWTKAVTKKPFDNLKNAGALAPCSFSQFLLVANSYAALTKSTGPQGCWPKQILTFMRWPEAHCKAVINVPCMVCGSRLANLAAQWYWPRVGQWYERCGNCHEVGSYDIQWTGQETRDDKGANREDVVYAFSLRSKTLVQKGSGPLSKNCVYGKLTQAQMNSMFG